MIPPRSEVQRQKAALEEAAARADLATKKVARMEELLARAAIEQRLVDEAMDERAAALSDRQAAEARLKHVEIQLRSKEAGVNEAQKLFDVVSEPGPDTPQKRESILRIHAETALRRAQADRDMAAAELDVFKTTLAGALANRDYRKKVTARLRQLVERKAVEQRLLDEAESQEKAADARVKLLQVDVRQAETKLKAAEEKLRDIEGKSKAEEAFDDGTPLKQQIEEELHRDPKVLMLRAEIEKCNNVMQKARKITHHPEKDPAFKQYASRLSDLEAQYHALQEATRELVRQRSLEREYRSDRPK